MYVVVPLIVSCVASIFYDGHRPTRGALTIFALIGVWLALFAGLRYHVGADTFEVEYLLRDIPPVHLFDSDTLGSTRFEPGLVILTGICRVFTGGFWLVQLVCALWINSAIFMTAWRYCPRRLFLFALLYILLQYLNLNFEIMRHSVGIGFLLMAWPYFERRDWLPYIFLSLCGVLFHRGMLVALLLPLCLLPPVKLIFKTDRNFLIGCATAFAAGLLLYKLHLLAVDTPDITRWIKWPLRGYTDTYPMYMSLNWKGVSVFIFLNALWPLAALLWSRSRWMPAMIAILVAFMVSRRLFDTFSIFAIIMMANAAGRRPSWLNGRIAAIAYLVPIALTIFTRTGYNTLGDGSRLPATRTYFPYYSWINPRVDSLRETYLLEIKDLHPYYEVRGDSLRKTPDSTADIHERSDNPDK